MTSTPTSCAPKVIVVTPWYGGNEGGVAVVTESLVETLIAAGHECAVVELVGALGFPEFRQGRYRETVLTMCLRDSGSVTGIKKRVGALARGSVGKRAFRKLLPDKETPCVVHLHYSAPEFDQLFDWCREWGVPFVSTFHGSDLTYNMLDERTRAVTHRQVQLSSAITAVSASLRETAVELFPEIADKITVIHNSVPPAFATAVHALVPPAERDIDVLFVGNLIDRKGVDVLLQAWKILASSHPTARLFVAGAGEDEVMLEDLAQSLGISSLVTFMGRLTREALPAVYRRAKILAVPSRSEPLGVVVLEGMLCGNAVVGSDIGGIPEIITSGENGLLVPIESPQELATAMARLLSDNALRDKLANAGIETVRVNFSSEGIAVQYQALYSRALKAGAASPLAPHTP